MSVFIKRFSFFIVILVIFSYLVDDAITTGLKKTGALKKSGTQEYSTWNAIVSSSIDADVIINGASRAYRHINPSILDSILKCRSYNIGMSGGDFNKQFVRYLTFEKYNEKPKYIIQEVDFSTFVVPDNNFDERFSPYLSDIGKDLIHRYMKWMKKYYVFVPLVRYFSQRSQIKQGLFEFFHLEHYPDLRKKGFICTETVWDGTALSKVLQKDSLTANKQPESIDLFDSYLNHCRQNNIQVILVFSPEYHKAMEFTRNKEEVIAIYHSLSKKYGYHFLDYTTDSLCYDTTYFFNALHLNRKGADIFTAKLAHDIDFLGILK